MKNPKEPAKPKVPPAFATEDEERRFWDEHDPSAYFAERAEAVVRLGPCPKRRRRGSQ